jgi:hypothetical protein
MAMSQEDQTYQYKYIKTNMFDVKETFKGKQYQEKMESINLLVESKESLMQLKGRLGVIEHHLPTKRCSMGSAEAIVYSQ